VLMRDSTVTNRFNAFGSGSFVGLTGFVTVVCTILLYGSGSFVGLTVVCVLLLVTSSRASSRLRLSSCGSSHTGS